MKSLSDLIADAQKLATHIAIGKKLAADLANNVAMASKVLSASDIETIKATYSQADLMETSRELDAAIEEAKAKGR